MARNDRKIGSLGIIRIVTVLSSTCYVLTVSFVFLNIPVTKQILPWLGGHCEEWARVEVAVTGVGGIYPFMKPEHAPDFHARNAPADIIFSERDFRLFPGTHIAQHK